MCQERALAGDEKCVSLSLKRCRSQGSCRRRCQCRAELHAAPKTSLYLLSAPTNVTSPKLTREIIITPLPCCASCLASNCATHYLLPCEFMLGGPRNTWCTGSERGRRNAHAPVPICTAPHTQSAKFCCVCKEIRSIWNCSLFISSSLCGGGGIWPEGYFNCSWRRS
jgi:hypothetical protein